MIDDWKQFAQKLNVIIILLFFFSVTGIQIDQCYSILVI